jgi:hypothetical protein
MYDDLCVDTHCVHMYWHLAYLAGRVECIYVICCARLGHVPAPPPVGIHTPPCKIDTHWMRMADPERSPAASERSGERERVRVCIMTPLPVSCYKLYSQGVPYREGCVVCG